MISTRGFCDLNVFMEGENRAALKSTCQKLIDLGYQAIAINTVCDSSIFESKKKKKKDEGRQGDPVPEPGYADIVKQFEGRLQIYQRLTVSLTEQLDAHKLSQSANAKKYEILAVIPTTQAAYQLACFTMDVDLISFDPENVGGIRHYRTSYYNAVSRGICFEIMYSPAIKSSAIRKNVVQQSHSYHFYGKSKNIIVTSGAAKPIHVRGPYDIINLSLLFGLSEEQAKGAISTTCRHLLLKAAGRRFGKTVVIASKHCSAADENGTVKMEVDETELPAKKRLKQEGSG